jgi:hypothetical protein
LIHCLPLCILPAGLLLLCVHRLWNLLVTLSRLQRNDIIMGAVHAIVRLVFTSYWLLICLHAHLLLCSGWSACLSNLKKR